MDASQRWETEALRTGSQFRKTPPRPLAKEETPEVEAHDPNANWVTLKEAEAETQIPVNTLRKWSRKSAIPSYLESDGDLSLRMVDLDAVITHAHDLGRETAPVTGEEDQEEQDDSDEADEAVTAPEGTLIVPLDAWNKMLNQLGNLHEAGQQLAEARERAVKAETEATFLRERLAEVRAESAEHPAPSEEPDASNRSDEATVDDPNDSPPFIGDGTGASAGDNPEPTTSYWRYLTFGWRDRKRRGSKET
jgi:hypothetical protein